MKPIIFDGVNAVYGKDQPEYQPLPAQRRGNPHTGEILTCWELSEEEKKRVAETGRVYLSMLTFGRPLQPVLISAEVPDIYDPVKNE